MLLPSDELDAGYLSSKLLKSKEDHEEENCSWVAGHPGPGS
jgi:hypothetical protein